MQRLDLGRGERERIDEALGAKTVAGDEGERHGALNAGLGEGARQFRGDECVVALGRARQRDGAALLEAANGGIKQAHGVCSALISALFQASRLSAAQARQERRVKFGRRRLLAHDPGQRLRIGGVEQTLERVELALAHRRQMRIGEPAHDKIHFPRAAAPGAKQNPPPPLIERSAAQSRAGHDQPFKLARSRLPALIAG